MPKNWHPIFETGTITQNYTNRELCAIALYGYADMLEAETIPDNWDTGFTNICNTLGITATKEALCEYSESLKK